METFTTFKESNLYSKKDWILPNHIVFYLNFLTPFIFAAIFFDIYRSYNGLKHKLLLLVIIYVGFMTADYISAFTHCFYIDDSYSQKDYPVEDGYLVVDVLYGYASLHHIFPSNWKDIPDLTIVTSTLFGFIIPFLLIYFIRDIPIKLTSYFIFLFLILSPISHKYAHEKLHKRETPFIIDILSEYGILLSPKNHQKHHIENNYNWSFLSGKTDPIFNILTKTLCEKYKKCPQEESTKNMKNHFVDKVKLKFVGDVEGTLECRIQGNLIVKLNP